MNKKNEMNKRNGMEGMNEMSDKISVLQSVEQVRETVEQVHETVGAESETIQEMVTTLLADEARREAAKPKPVPVQPPVAPVQQAPVMIQQPPVAAAQVEVPKATIPAPVALPEPISNYDDLIAFQKWRGTPDFKPDPRKYWLVNGARNLEFCTHAEQLAVAVDVWHRDYDRMPEFQNADRIWVILDPREDNRAFLSSIAANVWIRERCMLVRSSALDICRRRLMWDRDHNLRSTTSREFRDYDDREFEQAHNFVTIPAPSCVRELDKLLEKPPEPERVSPVGGSFGAPYGPQQPWRIDEDRGDERCGFAF